MRVIFHLVCTTWHVIITWATPLHVGAFFLHWVCDVVDNHHVVWCHDTQQEVRCAMSPMIVAATSCICNNCNQLHCTYINNKGQGLGLPCMTHTLCNLQHQTTVACHHVPLSNTTVWDDHHKHLCCQFQRHIRNQIGGIVQIEHALTCMATICV